MSDEIYNLTEAEKSINRKIKDHKRWFLNRFYEELPRLICHYAKQVREIEEVEGIGVCFKGNHVYLRTFVNKPIKKNSETYKKIQHIFEGIEASIGQRNIETCFEDSKDLRLYLTDHLIIH